jgi:hypothetical protein
MIPINNVQKRRKMNTNKKTTGVDMKVKLSMLWIFVLFNMAYADILSYDFAQGRLGSGQAWSRARA